MVGGRTQTASWNKQLPINLLQLKLYHQEAESSLLSHCLLLPQLFLFLDEMDQFLKRHNLKLTQGKTD